MDLLKQYRMATERAFLKAKFLSSTDLVTLQAFVLFLCCLRQYEDPRFIWNLTALAVRQAQGLELHQPSQHRGLSPYDLEMRRRLWLSLWLLDLRTALDLDSDFLISGEINISDLPFNINDSDLDPTQLETPSPRVGMTVMAHTLVRHDIGVLAKRLAFGQRTGKATQLTQSFDLEQMAQMEQMTVECKGILNERFLRYCIHGDALQWMTVATANLFFAQILLLIYEPVLLSTPISLMPQTIRDRLLIASIETIEHSHAFESKSSSYLRGWCFRTYLHWIAITLILETLYHKPSEPSITQRSWNAIHLAESYMCISLTSRREDKQWHKLVSVIKKTKQKYEANLFDKHRMRSAWKTTLDCLRTANRACTLAIQSWIYRCIHRSQYLERHQNQTRK